MANEIAFNETKLNKLILRFIIPAMLAMGVNGVYGVVERMFVGRAVGVEALSALTLISPCINIIAAFSVLTASGTGVLISIGLGKNEKDKVERIIGRSIGMCIALGIVAMLVIWLFSEQILAYLGGNGVNLELGRIYLNIIVLSIIIQNIGYVYNYAMCAVGKPEKSLVLLTLISVATIAFDAIFIYGFNLGIAGAAWSYLVGQLFGVIYGHYIFTNKKATILLRFSEIKVSIVDMKEIILNGLPLFLFQILVSIMLAITNKIFFNLGGNEGLAILGVVTSISTAFQMLTNGISQGIGPIIGYFYGAKKYDRLAMIKKAGIIIACIINLIGTIGMLLFADKLMPLFIEENISDMSIGVFGIRSACVTLPLVGIQLIEAGYYQSINQPKYSSIIHLLREFIVIVPMVWVISRVWGIKGGLIAFPISDVIVFIVMICIKLIVQHKNTLRQNTVVVRK